MQATPELSTAATAAGGPGDKGLKSDALGYVSNLVISIASTAPAYSMAATLGFIVAVVGVGVHAPAVLIVSFIPILFVSVGYRFLNLADPDAGTTFAWVTRAFGPQIGWINGWAIFLADIMLVKVYANSPVHSIQVSASWFDRFDLSFGALIDAVLLGIFIYWGWDSGVAVNEESRDRHRGPGKAAVISTVILLVIYIAVSVAAQAFHGTKFLAGNSADVLNALGGGVFGSPLDKLMIIAVLTSASASTQTTILPTARTTLSMAHWKAIPKAFGEVHPRFLTPTFSTLLMGGLSILWTIALLAFNPKQNVLGDTISALGFSVVFYYGFTGLACAVYFRRDLLKSVRNFVLAGVIPLIGGLMMGYIGVKAYGYYSTAGNNYSKPLLGIQTPIVVGIGGLIVGIVLMFAAWPFFPQFFSRRWLEAADPEILVADAARR